MIESEWAEVGKLLVDRLTNENEMYLDDRGSYWIVDGNLFLNPSESALLRKAVQEVVPKE